MWYFFLSQISESKQTFKKYIKTPHIQYVGLLKTMVISPVKSMNFQMWLTGMRNQMPDFLGVCIPCGA